MSDQLTPTTSPTKFINRIGNFFRKAINDAQSDTVRFSRPALPDGVSEEDNYAAAEVAGEARTTFLRPWHKREQAIDQLQTGVATLSDLMGTIRDTLERSSDRQDELLNYLSALPRAVESLPESNRVQGEALKAIQVGIEQQNEQQNKLATVLLKMHEADTEQAHALAGVRDRVDAMAAHEQAISQSLTAVGAALQGVNDNAAGSARVLENLRDNLSSRDSELERVIRRQNTRFTTMLTVAIVMSMAALTAVVVFGYPGYETLNHMR